MQPCNLGPIHSFGGSCFASETKAGWTVDPPIECMRVQRTNHLPLLQALTKMNDKISDACKKIKQVQGMLGPWWADEDMGA